MLVKMETGASGGGGVENLTQVAVADVLTSSSQYYDTNVTASDGRMIFVFLNGGIDTTASAVAYIKNGSVQYIAQNVGSVSVDIVNGNFGIKQTTYSQIRLFYIVLESNS